MRNIKQNIFSKNKKQTSLVSLNKDINSLSNLNLSDICNTIQNKENIKYNNNNTTFSFYQKNNLILNKQIKSKDKKYSKLSKNTLNIGLQKNIIDKKQKIKLTKSFNEYQFNKLNKKINPNMFYRTIKKPINNLISDNNNLSKNIINNFSQMTYNIYNINTLPIPNLPGNPLINHKKFFSQRAFNDTSYFTKKNINYSDFENENEKNQTISSYRLFSYEKKRINNNSVKNKIKYKKQFYNIANIYKNNKSFFKFVFFE